MVTGEHIWPEFAPGYDVVSNELERRPPLGIDQGLVSEPIRNLLLANGLAWPAEFAKFGRKLGLATNKIDRPPESSNVVFLHRSGILTRNLVRVNKSPCLTDDKGPCTVLSMTTAKKKPARALVSSGTPARKSAPIVGPDGFTMSQRVLRLMAEQGMSQTGLAEACSRYYAAFINDEPDRVKQQHIFNIVQGQDSSWVVPLIAEVFDVNPLWLQLGIGKREKAKH